MSMPRLVSCTSLTLPSRRVVTLAPFLAVTVLLPAAVRAPEALVVPAGALAGLPVVVEGLAAVPLPFAVGRATAVPLANGAFVAEAPPPELAAGLAGAAADLAGAAGLAGAVALAGAAGFAGAAGLDGLVCPSIARMLDPSRIPTRMNAKRLLPFDLKVCIINLSSRLIAFAHQRSRPDSPIPIVGCVSACHWVTVKVIEDVCVMLPPDAVTVTV